MGAYFMSAAVHHFVLVLNLQGTIGSTLQWIHVGFDVVLVLSIMALSRVIARGVQIITSEDAEHARRFDRIKELDAQLDDAESGPQ